MLPTAGLSQCRGMPLPNARKSRAWILSLSASGIFFFAGAADLARAGAPEGVGDGHRSSMDKGNSFRGVRFGSSLEEIKKSWELEALPDDAAPGDPLKLFIRNDEVKSLGTIALQEVVYYFFEGKFYAVGICTPDSRQTGTLRQALEIAYGRSPHVSPAGDSFVWEGENVSAQLNVAPGTGEGRALLFNNDLQSAYEKFFLQAAGSAAAEL